ncbi:hypothetical protein U2F10_03120 [Leptothoe sp. EHU-05/26/07-4]
MKNNVKGYVLLNAEETHYLNASLFWFLVDDNEDMFVHTEVEVKSWDITQWGIQPHWVIEAEWSAETGVEILSDSLEFESVFPSMSKLDRYPAGMYEFTITTGKVGSEVKGELWVPEELGYTESEWGTFNEERREQILEKGWQEWAFNFVDGDFKFTS